MSWRGSEDLGGARRSWEKLGESRIEGDCYRGTCLKSSICNGICDGCLQRVFVTVFCNGRLQNAPTQHTLKVIDYQSNQLW